MPPLQPVKIDIPDVVAQGSIEAIEAFLVNAHPELFQPGTDLTHALACSASHLIWQWPHDVGNATHASIHFEYLPTQMIVQVAR